MNRFLIFSFLFLLFVLMAFFQSWRVRNVVLELKHDHFHKSTEVTSVLQIDKILSTFKQISYNELTKEYLVSTKSNNQRYKKLLKGLTYYKIPRSQLNIPIVGKFRVKEFLSKDKAFKQCILNKRDTVICIFNKKIFYKTLELQNELAQQGFNKYGFKIVNGHRHPKYNEQVGGAKLSRHIKGEAIDIVVRDINKDGQTTPADKAIVLKILNEKIIIDQGGIGLYPGTDNIHYDVRGTKARWDSY